MPQIPVSKSPFSTTAERASLGREAVSDPKLIQHKPIGQSIGLTQAQGPKPITQTTKPSSPNAVHPRGSVLVKMVNGVRDGLRPAHNVAVLDLTSDTTQFLPYMAHCDTCAWEGRFVSLEQAEANAAVHAGV
jgi:hypothetical protein